MRKLTIMNQVRFDGFYSAPGEGWDTIDWHRVDDEWNEMSVANLEATGTLLFGRKTYEGFASFWPTHQGRIADLINGIDKAVVSTTLHAPGWNNARLLNGDLKEQITALKAEPGGPIAIYGSGALGQALTALGLIDEYILAIVPVVLGVGQPLFRPGAPKLDFELVSARTLSPSGVIYATYRKS